MFLNKLSHLFQAKSTPRNSSSKSISRRKALRSKERTLRLENLESRQLMAVVSHADLTKAMPAPAIVAEATNHATIGTATASLGSTPAGASATHANLLGASAALAAPAAPSFTLKAVSETQIDLTFKHVAGATKYVVNAWDGSAWKQISSVDNTVSTIHINGGSAGTTYKFEIGAGNAAGVTFGKSQSVTTPVYRPVAPSVTATANSASQIGISWKAISDATGYVVDEMVNGSWKQIGSYNGNTTGMTATGLNAQTTYQFKVEATNSAGSNWSPVVKATTLNVGVPLAPTLSAIAVSPSQINLAWTNTAGATSYQVDEWINGAWTSIGSYPTTKTSLSVGGLTAGTNYYFDVAAVNSAGTTWSPYVTATTAAAVTIDHPAAATAYTVATGSLFGTNGPVYTDVHQGSVGDCWLLASLAEVAAMRPADITNMFTLAGTTVENGATVTLYSVRFYNVAGSAVTVTVDTELPSGGSYYDKGTDGVLWVALAEKAYAQANGLGYVTTGNVGSDSYAALDGGDPQWALHAITGQASNTYSNPASAAAGYTAGQLVVLGSSSSANDNLIVGDANGTHAYAMIGYNSMSKTLELFNPWNLTSTLNGTVNYNGHAVYGGTFNVSADIIAQDFAIYSVGTGAAHRANVLGISPTNAHHHDTVLAKFDMNAAASIALPASPAAGSTNTNAPHRSQMTNAIDELFASFNHDDLHPEIALPIHG